MKVEEVIDAMDYFGKCEKWLLRGTRWEKEIPDEHLKFLEDNGLIKRISLDCLHDQQRIERSQEDEYEDYLSHIYINLKSIVETETNIESFLGSLNIKTEFKSLKNSGLLDNINNFEKLSYHYCTLKVIPYLEELQNFLGDLTDVFSLPILIEANRKVSKTESLKELYNDLCDQKNKASMVKNIVKELLPNIEECIFKYIENYKDTLRLKKEHGLSHYDNGKRIKWIIPFHDKLESIRQLPEDKYEKVKDMDYKHFVALSQNPEALGLKAGGK